ncbi:TPA: hypothetical protein ACOEEW_003191 [Enterobacter kobei]
MEQKPVSLHPDSPAISAKYHKILERLCRYGYMDKDLFGHGKKRGERAFLYKCFMAKLNGRM